MNLKKLFFILFIALGINVLGKVPKIIQSPKAREQSLSQSDLPLFMRVEEYNIIQQQIHLHNNPNVAIQQNASAEWSTLYAKLNKILDYSINTEK